MRKTRTSLLATLVLAAVSIVSAQGATLIVADNYNVANTGSGFATNAGVNSGIYPPVTRLTGQSAQGLRYIKYTGTKADNAHAINANRFRVNASANSSTITLSPGTGPFNFSSALRTVNATPALPSVYEYKITMGNSSAANQRCSFAISTEPGVVGVWDFGLQIYRTNTADDFYIIQKRIDSASSGLYDDINTNITTTAVGTWTNGTVSFFVRVTDAGTQTDTSSSRIQVSLDGGATWIYDTQTDPDLPYGFRFDTAGRYFFWDIAGQAAATYDDFELNWISGPEASVTQTWSGAGADDNWSTGANWLSGEAPLSGDKLIFTGTTRQTNANDISPLTVSSVVFSNGGFELTGSQVTLSAGITNFSGNNTISLPTAWESASPKSWTLAPGSMLTLNSSVAVDVGGDHTIRSGGTLQLLNQFTIGGQSSATPAFEIGEGRMVIDGSSAQFTSSGGFRMGVNAAVNSQVEFVLTNGANFRLNLAGGAFRIGDSANKVTNRVIINNSTLQMSGGDMGLPWAAGATGEVFQVGGSVSGCDLNFNHAGAGVGTYSIKNGVLEPRQIAKPNAGGTSSIFFDGATLRTYTVANNPFMAALDVAEIRSGGLTIDATTADIRIDAALSGVGSLTKSGSYAAILTGPSTYTGNTVVQGGRLLLPTVQTNTGNVQVAADAQFGVILTTEGTTYKAGTVTLPANSSLNFDLGTFGNPTAPLMQVATLSASGTVSINVTNGSLFIQPGTVNLVKYSTLSGAPTFQVGSLPAHLQGNIVHTAGSIDLVITGVQGFRWTGAASSDWDFAMVNWIKLPDNQASAYSDYLYTEFRDGATRGDVNVTTVSPGGVNVSNNVLAYTFTGGTIITPIFVKSGSGTLTRVDASNDGIGTIEINEGSFAVNNSADASFAINLSDTSAGAGTFVKQGVSTLTLASTNASYDGKMEIRGGILKVGTADALGSSNGTLTVFPGGSLDVNDVQSPHKPVVVSGTGFNGIGAITEQSGTGGVQHNLTDVTMVGDTSFGCATGGRWDIRVRAGTGVGPGLRGNGFNMTKIGGGTLSIACQRHDYGTGVEVPYWDMNLGDVVIAEGGLTFAESLTPGNPTKTITIAPGANMSTYDLSLTNPILRKIIINDAQLASSGSARDTNVFAGPIELTGTGHLRVNADTRMIVSGAISGNGTITYSDSGVGMLLLDGVNTFVGQTIVTNGTLSGGGSIAGDLVMLGGTFAPGYGVGTFTVGGAANLAGTTAIQLAPGQTQNSDRLVATGAINAGGVLNVVFASGAATPAAGEVFQIFNKGVTGFSAVNLPSLAAFPGGLEWDQSGLAVNGSIKVKGTLPPSIGTVSVTGGTFTFSGTGGTEGATYYILSSPNAAAPITSWTPVATNVFGAGGTFNFNLNISGGTPEAFFRLAIP